MLLTHSQERPSTPSLAVRLEEEVPQEEWLMKLERVLLKESGDLPEGGVQDMDIEEVFRLAPGSLAVAVLDEVVTVKDLVLRIIGEAETIRRRWSLAE